MLHTQPEAYSINADKPSSNPNNKPPKPKRPKAQPPNADILEKDVRACIEEIHKEVEATTPDIPKEPQLTKEELEKSEWLDQQVKEKILDHYAEDVFRENIPGIREQGEPIEAIPTPQGI